MLHHIGEHEAADKVQAALEFTYRKKKDKLTKDVGGTAGTSEFADAVVESMSEMPSVEEVLGRPVTVASS
jgi:isocitrate dehydrogenase (NAD+)